MASPFQWPQSSSAKGGRSRIEHSRDSATPFHGEAASETASISSRTAALITQAIETKSEEIPREARRLIEARGGFDLAGIEIHVGRKAARAARALGARAFSVSRHIVFGEDQFCPNTDCGLWLLAHELAHAVKQGEVPAHGYFLGAADSTWESWADAFAHLILGSAGQPQPWMQHLPGVPTGLVLRHNGPQCPQPPDWISISAKPYEIWLTANYAIELAYKNSHQGHVMIFGGDFITGHDIALPRDTNLSDIDRRFGNQLLHELRGLQWQLRPDIIDFTERKFYEIKTAKYASSKTAKAVEQLASYYRVAEAIRVKYGGPQWDPEAPNWYPPHVLPFDSDPDRVVCTSATEYKLGKEYLKTINRPGLILYSVLEKVGSEERRKKRALAMRLARINSQLIPVRELLEKLVPATLPQANDRTYLLVGTREYMDSVLMPGGNIARVTSLLNVPAMDTFQNPVVMMRLLGWSVVGISELLYITVPLQVVLVGEEAAALAAPLGVQLIEVPQAILNGLKAANDVIPLGEAALGEAAIPLGQAAGILFVIGVANASDAQAATIPMLRIGIVRAIPLHSTWGLGPLEPWSPLEWAGTQYFFLGFAISTE